MPRVGRDGPGPGRSGIQTLVFNKDNWTRESAQAWARDHDFFASPVDETDSSYRIRQFDPEYCAADSFETLTENMPEGVSMVQCTGRREQSRVRGAVNELLLYDEIGEFESTARFVVERLREAKGADVIVAINSPGGDVFEGQAIFQAIKRYSGRVTARIDALAASAAGYIAMAADEVVMAPGAMLMLHSPLAFTIGNADALRDVIDRLEMVERDMVRVYAQKTGLDEDRIRQMLRDESWLDADEAVAQGFADRIDEGVAMAACIYGDLSKYKNVPQRIACMAKHKLSPDEQIDLARRNIEAARQQNGEIEQDTADAIAQPSDDERKSEMPAFHDSAFPVFPREEAIRLRDEWPEIWARGKHGEEFGRLVEGEVAEEREQWATQHGKGYTLDSVVAQVQHLVVSTWGLDHMTKLLAAEKEKVAERRSRRNAAEARQYHMRWLALRTAPHEREDAAA